MEFKKTRKHRPATWADEPHEQPAPHTEERVQKVPARLSRFSKRMLIAIASIVVAIIVISVVYSIIADRLASTPSFQALLPADKSISQLGGWTRVSPPGEPPAFAYSDTIDDVTVRVSEQQLPNNSQSVADIAKGYNAVNKITAGAVTAYIGTSFKGPQSVIVEKKGVLLLIGSTSVINNDSWASYIESLQ